MAERITGMSLRDVRKLLDDRSLGEQAFDALDQLIDAALIFSPAALGLAGFTLHALLEPKDHLVALCKNVIKAISKPDARDYLDRAEDLAAAHCLLTYSAFFEALDQCLPDLLTALQFSTEEKWRTAITWPDGSGPVTSQQRQADSVARSGFTAADLSRTAIPVPHPAVPEEVPAEGHRRDLYNVMGINLMRLLTEVASDVRWDRATPAERERLRTELEETIPSLAERIYHGELVGLAIEFPQFLTWLTLVDQDAKDALIRKIGTDTRVQFELVGRTVDLGLQGLAAAWRGRLPRLCARALDSLLLHCGQGAWRLLDIPNQLWSYLADLFVSGGAGAAQHRTDFASLLGAEISEAGIKPGGASTEFLIHATRIGVRTSDEILSLSTRIFSFEASGDIYSRKCLLLLIRLAREIDRREIVNELRSRGYRVTDNEEYDTAWKTVFGIPHDQPSETINLEQISPGLTYREAMDLRWLIDIAREVERSHGADYPGSHR